MVYDNNNNNNINRQYKDYCTHIIRVIYMQKGVVHCRLTDNNQQFNNGVLLQF